MKDINIPQIHKTAVSISFHADDLDPDEITRALGQPEQSVRKGGEWIHPGNRKQIARTGRWQTGIEYAEPGNLEQQIIKLFSRLGGDLDAWIDFTTRYKSRLFVGLFLARPNEGLSLSPETLSAIGARGLELELDIYSARITDEDETP